MLEAFLSPLATAAVLLLGALVLPIATFQFPIRWRILPWLRQFGVPGLVGLATLALLGVCFTTDAGDMGLELLSGWDFSTANLTIHVDTLSLPFLLVTVLILLAVTLATPLILPFPDHREENISDLSIWLTLGAGVCCLFVSANGLTLVYAVVGFDILTLFYWLQRGQRDISIARLFLGIFTSLSLSLAGLTAVMDTTIGAFWLGLALWLRLGLYPFVEATLHSRWSDYGGLIYQGLSLMVGIYLATRVVTQPLPALILWLTVAFILLNGLLAWLTDQTSLMLTRFLLAEALLVLLIAPVQANVTIVYMVGLISSVAVLWITPYLGRHAPYEPSTGREAFIRRGWTWPYLPAVAATLTLMGLPFSLGWSARTAIYETLFFLDDTLILWGVILAETLALSGLISYWLIMWQGNEISERRSMVGIVVVTPFLIPGLAPLILSILIKTELPSTNLAQPFGVYIALFTTIIGAIGLGYFKKPLSSRLGVSPNVLARLFSLGWLLYWLENLLDQMGRLILRIRAVLEGQHYVGWALFAALVGILVILLGR